MSDASETVAVILAGGSGTRFWPASRRLRPKQLLALGPSAPLSLIASTVERLAGFVSPENVLVATGRHLVSATKKELPHLGPGAFLAETRARNTAPCIAWAAHVVARRNPEAIVCVLPSDQHATDGEEFRRVMAFAAEEARQGIITTIGIVPTRPETGYGYIRRGRERRAGAYAVDGFFEKPHLDTAQEYLKNGNYYWNAGIFVFRAKDMVDAVDRHLPNMTADLRAIDAASRHGAEEEDRAIEDFFLRCESISIDYGVMEKESNLAVIPGDFGWSDLGSWESAWELSPKDRDGNAVPAHAVCIDSRDNLIEDMRTESGNKTIALVGVEGLCIIQTDDALLVMPRERSQDVREVVRVLQEKDKGDLI